jgi:transposase InsO family protein
MPSSQSRPVSRTGSCLDGAAESFFATIKAEIGIESWPDRATARRDIENWITDCNRRRLRSSLGSQTPCAARQARQERMSMAVRWIATLRQMARPVT